MVKFLFLDYRQVERIDGFVRKLERPRKETVQPLVDSVQNWGKDWMSLYGSVIRRPEDGLFQMWYTTRLGERSLVLAYAESRDGIAWQRPALELVRVKRRKTNIVLDEQPHGVAVLYDREEPRPDWRYKMVAGASPSGRISAFRSPDGIRWFPAAENPVVGSHPDCPMSLCRLADGRYVAYHRPGFGDRRVGRTESWDFRNFGPAEVVMEPDQSDPPNTQLYGLGAVPYGAYLIGTLWIYHTDADDMGFYKMSGYQEPELVHARGSCCWHRTAQGEPWIRVEKDEERFDSGQIQPASQPVFMEDEIRYYYVGTRTRHGVREWKGPEPRAGLRMAACKPDRFVGITAKEQGRLLTRPFWTETPRFRVNARVVRGGWVKAEVVTADGTAIEGFRMRESVAVTGDSTGHTLAWRGDPDPSALGHREIRVRLHCEKATLYSLYAGTAEEEKQYWHFRIASHLNMEREREMAWVSS